MIAQGIGRRLPTHCYACNSPRTWAIQVDPPVHACPFHLGDAVEWTGADQLLITLSPHAATGPAE